MTLFVTTCFSCKNVLQSALTPGGKMKKISFFLLIFMMFINAQATPKNCYNTDSRSFRVSEEPDNIQDTVSIDNVANVIFQIGLKYKCSPVNIKHSECSTPFKSEMLSNLRVCLIEADVGYFIITPDYLGNLNVIFNRWD